MRPSTRCRGRCTPTTRSTASWPGWASATSSPPTAGPRLGLRLLDTDMRVLAELKRSPEPSANGYPQMNMFDQPELEGMMRANLKRYPHVVLRGDVEVTSVTQNQPGQVRVSFLDRVRGGEQSVEAATCWAATAPTA